MSINDKNGPKQQGSQEPDFGKKLKHEAQDLKWTVFGPHSWKPLLVLWWGEHPKSSALSYYVNKNLLLNPIVKNSSEKDGNSCMIVIDNARRCNISFKQAQLATESSGPMLLTGSWSRPVSTIFHVCYKWWGMSLSVCVSVEGDRLQSWAKGFIKLKTKRHKERGTPSPFSGTRIFRRCQEMVSPVDCFFLVLQRKCVPV